MLVLRIKSIAAALVRARTILFLEIPFCENDKLFFDESEFFRDKRNRCGARTLRDLSLFMP
jgi:hypothetical protein